MSDEERMARAWEIAERMHVLLWGPRDAPGPGKVTGRQQQLRELSLQMVRLFRTREGDDES